MARLLVYICALFLTAASPAAAAPDPAQAYVGPVGINLPAPDFRLMNLKGESKSLSQYRGKIVLVNFWASWCPYCVNEMPSMDRLTKLFKGDLVILAVNVEKRIPEKYRKASVSLDFLSDVGGVVQQKYGASRLPDTFIVDRKGIVRQRVTGGIPWDDPKVVSYLKSL